MTRRIICTTLLLPLAALAAIGCTTRGNQAGTRVIVLGFDGLDYEITRALVERGEMPAFAQLAASGSFAPLGTSVPPRARSPGRPL